MKDANIPGGVTKPKRDTAHNQLHDYRKREHHVGLIAQGIFHPQTQRGQQNKQGDAVLPFRKFAGDGAIGGPDKGPGKRQRIAQRAGNDIPGYFLKV